MSLTEGTTLGPFKILSLIGQGGMGEVYKARDTRLGRDVAIKVLPQDWATDPERLERFERESRAVAQLSHSNLVHLLDVGEQEGLPYLVMELLEGEPLRAILDRGRLPIRKALDLGRQVAQGLSAAHDAGIIHRDLKPENVFLTKDGTYKLLDFGLAQAQSLAAEANAAVTSPLGLLSSSRLTQQGVMLGTLGYLAPEQISGGEVGVQADIFSLGVLLWEALTGHPPFGGATIVDTLHAILRKEPPDLPAELGVPSGLERILHRCLEKDPSSRFRSAHDLALALEASGGSLSSGLLPSRLGAVEAPDRNRRLLLGVGGVLLACLVGLSGWFLRPDARKKIQFTRITPKMGIVTGAGFLPGNQGLLFSASKDAEQPEEIFRVSKPGELPRSLGIKGATLLSVNDKGELLLLLRSTPQGRTGTLAVLPPNAMAPRELAHGVAWAAWGPDGVPIIKHYRYQGRRTNAFEYPKGRILYEVPFGFLVSTFTVSPDLDRIAFLEGRSNSLYLVTIRLASGEVRRRLLGKDLSFSSTKLGWGRKGLLFSRWDPGRQSAQLLRLNDRLEPVSELMGLPWAYDFMAGRDGSWLLNESSNAFELHWLRPGEKKAIPAEWSENQFHSVSLSADGSLVAGMDDRGIFVLRAGNPSPVFVGEGSFMDVSPDGRWILSKVDRGGAGTILRILPVGEGENQTVPGEWISNSGTFLPGYRQILLTGKRMDVADQGSFVVDLESGAIRRLSEEMVLGPISPDGQHALLFSPKDMAFRLFDLRTAKADPRILASYGQDTIAGWTADSRALWIVPKEQPDPSRIQISRFDLAGWTLRPSHTLPLPATHHHLAILLSQDGQAGLVMVEKSSLGFLFLAQGID